MMKIPTIPCPFPESPAELTKDDNLDIFYRANSTGSPMVRGVLYSLCRLCKLLSGVDYNTGAINEPGSVQDSHDGSELYRQLCNFAISLPSSLYHHQNFTH